MLLRWVLPILLVAGAARAEDWQSLPADAALTALAGHVLVYPTGVSQRFSPSGDTAYDSGYLKPGRWRIDAGRYCSLWPPVADWTCFDLARSADGQSLRFTGDDGRVMIGRYAD